MSEVLNFKQHKLLHGDITKGSVDLLMKEEKFDILYSDPPWGLGNLKFWNTMNAKMNNIHRFDVDWENFIRCFCEIINKYSKDESIVIIEMGLRFSDYFASVIERYTNFRRRQTFNTRYRGGGKLLPLHIMYFSKNNGWLFIEQEITNTYGFKCTDIILKQCSAPKQIVLDPCCGFGRTLKVSHKYNMTFRGNEINKKRLDKAIDYAERKI